MLGWECSCVCDIEAENKTVQQKSTPWTSVPFLKNERYKDDLPFTPLQFSLGKTQVGFLFLSPNF